MYPARCLLLACSVCEKQKSDLSCVHKTYSIQDTNTSQIYRWERDNFSTVTTSFECIKVNCKTSKERDHYPFNIEYKNMSESPSAHAKVKSRFWSILQGGLTKLMAEAQGTWNGPDAQDYASEKILLSRCYRPLMWGMGATCLCFVTFRVTGSASFRQLKQTLKMQGNRKPLKKQPSEDKGKNQWKSSSERILEERTAALNDVMTMPVDAILSIMIGISITGITLSPSQRKKELEIAPLLRGKSLLSQYMCQDMKQLYHQADPTLWKEPDETLETLRNFAINCKKRDEVEQVIRHEQQLMDDQLVSIPPPNVDYWYGKEKVTK